MQGYSQQGLAASSLPNNHLEQYLYLLHQVFIHITTRGANRAKCNITYGGQRVLKSLIYKYLFILIFARRILGVYFD